MGRFLRRAFCVLKWGVTVALVLAILVVSVVAAFHRQILPKLLLQPARYHDRMQYVWNRFDRTDFETITSDGLKLACFYGRTKIVPARGTCLILHGHSFGKDGMAWLAKRLVEAGYDVVAFDARAHGDSEGDLSTVGALEGEDAITVIQKAGKRFALPHPRIVIGFSLGAATAIRMITLPGHTMNGAIVVSPYARLRDVVTREARKYLWFVDTAEQMNDAEKMAGRDMWSFAPVELAGKISIPILMMHGSADTRFPIAEGREVFDAIPASTGKKFVEAMGVGHNDVLSWGNTWSATTFGALDDFLKSMSDGARPQSGVD